MDILRLDKYLKVSRLIIRRTIANQMCDSGKVKINEKVAKASTEVKSGDIIEIRFGDKITKVEILEVLEHVTKAGASEMYKVI